MSRKRRRRGRSSSDVRLAVMRLLRTPKFWAGCGAAWITLTLVETTTTLADAARNTRDVSPAGVVLDRAFADLVWFFVAALVFTLMDRAVERNDTGKQIARRFVILGVATAPLYVSWAAFTYTVMHDAPLSLQRVASVTLMWDVFLFSLITMTAATVLLSARSRRHERAGAELRSKLAHAELELLRAQLEPHFLFNALNTIAGLIRVARPDLATRALAKLSELLRYVVEASRVERVPLAWELDFIANYLELQQMRFGQRLQFEIHQEVGRGCEVPPLLLQPLIENAVVHGVARTSDPVTIHVHVTMEDGELRVEVDNTRDHRAAVQASTGVGLTNTRQRLERMYGDGFAFDAGPAGPDHYRVTISLPHSVAYA